MATELEIFDMLLILAVVGVTYLLLDEYTTNKRNGDDWIITHLMAASSQQFEKIVQEYYSVTFEGGTDFVNRTDQVGDRGLDVIIDVPWEIHSGVHFNPNPADAPVHNQGYKKIGIQCKRYEPGNNVGRPTIQKTKGAADERGCDKAVVVTSSGFTDGAIDSADALDVKLIDGEELLRRLSSNPVSPRQWGLDN